VSQIKKYKLSKDPLISKVLDVSTAHISEKDDELLKKTNQFLSVYNYEFGYIVCINVFVKRKPLKVYGYSDHIIKILYKAKKLNCSYVIFDADGVIYDDLRQFNW
jgi:hypothetical protein